MKIKKIFLAIFVFLVFVAFILIIRYDKTKLSIKNVTIYYESILNEYYAITIDKNGNPLPISHYMKSITYIYLENGNAFVKTVTSYFKLKKLQKILKEIYLSEKPEDYFFDKPKLICVVKYRKTKIDTFAFSSYSMKINSKYYEIDPPVLSYFAKLLPRKYFKEIKDFYNLIK